MKDELNKASQKYEEEHKPEVLYYEDGVPVEARITLSTAFRAGAEWQEEQTERERQHNEFITNAEQEALKLNPYEYIVKCALDGVTKLGSLCDDEAIVEAAKLCVGNLKEQLVKDAIDGEVTWDEDGFNIIYPKMVQKSGKVKLIIIKEDKNETT